jgi:predicted amidohydrolase YtcJ
LHPDFVKVFLDGGPGTMALLEPTPLNPQTRPLIDGATLDALVADYDRQGVSIMAHAHGDAAIRGFIDAVMAARRANGTGVRHHVAHCSSIHPQDVSRLVAADVVCDFSPYIWFPSPLVEGARPVLGDAHMERLYPASMMVAGGATLAGGSDWGYDNADLNPLPFLEALVTRRDPSGRTPGTWGAQWTISVPQAITVFTLNGARALRLEAETGSLEPGKRADFRRRRGGSFLAALAELVIAALIGGATALAGILSGAFTPPAGSRLGVLVCGSNTDPASVVG